jgi:hypothetical protein
MRKPVALSEGHCPEDERKSRHERYDRRAKVLFAAFAETAESVFHFVGQLGETAFFNPIQWEVFSHFIFRNIWSFIFEVLLYEIKVSCFRLFHVKLSESAMIFIQSSSFERSTLTPSSSL